MHDITALVAKIVAQSGIRTGTGHVFNVGSTACVGMIEFEPGLATDLPAILRRGPGVVSFGLAPGNAGGWGATVAELSKRVGIGGAT